MSRNLTGPAKVPPASSVSFDSAKNARRQAYVSVESADVPLNAIAISPTEQREHMATLERRLSVSTKDMRTLFDYEKQRIVVTSIIREVAVYTLLAILLLVVGVGLDYTSHLGADTILNAAAEVTPR